MKSSDELIARREKLKQLKSLGAEPYGGAFLRTCCIKELRENFENFQSSRKEVSIAGRIMLLRSHGKASFTHLRDETGEIQLYVKFDVVGEAAYGVFKLLDVGDFIGARGTLFKTKTGEMSLLALELKVLSKSLRPLPEKWHGLKDKELRYRRRYLDLIMNEKSKEVFRLRTEVISIIRDYLNRLGYMEVETPMLHPIPGGASGKPFKTKAETLGMELYLRIAPELYLKRLLVGGFEKIYEINRSFRNEGLSRRHSPEFTMLEVYTAFADYNDMMELTEKMIERVITDIKGETVLKFCGEEVNLAAPWRRVSFNDAIKENFNLDIERDGMDTLTKRLKKEGVELSGEKVTRNQILRILSEMLRSNAPTFVIDYPIELCPLAKRKPGNEKIAERFELFMCGCELANAYSELNDPEEQRERFLKQAKEGEGGEPDEDFLLSLEYGMPPAGGLGIGIDRLLMLLTDSYAIRDVILFPQLKKEV